MKAGSVKYADLLEAYHDEQYVREFAAITARYDCGEITMLECRRLKNNAVHRSYFRRVRQLRRANDRV